MGNKNHPNAEMLLELLDKYRHGTMIITFQDGIPQTVEEVRLGRISLGKLVDVKLKKTGTEG
ncbi:hypothetical protein EDC14_1004156 [Hydrogenispora ethanolica]|uniref:Uncharacterized protein n=1 Tax=Hydrogenispora ethanolica TaxID=1082276 RepID=A0A4R1S4R8_HYDET|nr:hypothetical protein [Hydrogenispora ethanolica]TCL74218.1 hypothetical protein EDC14_1004156 [Hydrogenispora ethanolica]